MKWYFKFWFHNWRAKVWHARAKDRRLEMIVAETHQAHHEGRWNAMKRDMGEFK